MATPEPYPYRQLNYPVNNLEQNFDQTKKIQVRANIGIPTSVNKAGQVLTVGDSTGELEWATVSGGGDVPSSSSADEGKVLTVDSNGEPQWAPPSGGGGDVTDVKVNGTSVVTNHVAEVTVPTKTSDLDNDSGFITSGDIPSVDEVPAVTSSDDGKVLTASYSGGQGSYSWETAPSAPTYSEGNMIDISAQGVIGVETTAGITDIQMVNALPANPVATVLYLIPAN
jgi:hypothetical protein